jgi:hypothetical protein
MEGSKRARKTSGWLIVSENRRLPEVGSTVLPAADGGRARGELIEGSTYQAVYILFHFFLRFFDFHFFVLLYFSLYLLLCFGASSDAEFQSTTQVVSMLEQA